MSIALPARETQVQVTHASGLHSVNRLLAQMHREMLRSSGVAGGAVRLSVVNVVAACVDVASADLAARAVGSIASKHPARAIIVMADPEAPTDIEAELSLRCVPVRDGQMCTEQVRLQVAGAPAFHLASVVNPLLVPDIPVYLWLAGSPPMRQAFGQDAVAICERVIIDTGAYQDVVPTLRTLAAELDVAGDALSLSDMTWERFRPWRQLIANAFDGSEMRPYLRAVEAVRIACVGSRTSAQAWLLAGWLASRLRWPDDIRRVEVVASSDPDSEDGDLSLVELHCLREGSAATVRLDRHKAALRAVIDTDNGLHAERAIRFDRLDTVDVVSSLLEHTTEDPAYRPALTSGLALASSAG